MVIIREAVHKGVLVPFSGGIAFRVFPCSRAQRSSKLSKRQAQNPNSAPNKSVVLIFSYLMVLRAKLIYSL